mgnify:CR=1 FL=1
MNPKAIEIANRLQDNPELLARVESLLNIVEDAGGNLKKAADAEMRVIEELRKMGNEALTGWGKRQSDKAATAADQDPTTRRMGKKKSAGTAVTDKSS